eukprot:scaffold19935_cov108-Isochrysis_galbana.AAC.10
MVSACDRAGLQFCLPRTGIFAASFHRPQAVYASFPLHIASDDSSLLDRRLDKLVEEWQWDEVHAYNGAEDSGDGNDG